MIVQPDLPSDQLEYFKKLIEQTKKLEEELQKKNKEIEDRIKSEKIKDQIIEQKENMYKVTVEELEQKQ